MANKIWLVRSGGRILGPYEKKEIAEKLKTREISLHDDVADPMKIWRPIVNKPELADIVSTVKVQIQETETKTSNLEESKTYTVTEGMDPRIVGELTEEIASTPPPANDEIVIDDIKEEPSGATKNKSAKKKNPQKSYGYEASSAAKAQADGLSSNLWRFVVWLAIAIVLVLGFYYLVFLPGKASETSENSFDLGKRQLEIGLYSQAEKSFERAYTSRNTTPLLPLYLGALMAQLSTDAIDAEKMLMSVNHPDSKIKAMTFSSLAVLELRQENFDQARKWTTKSLDLKPSYTPALLNSAWLDINVKDYQSGKNQLNKSLVNGSEVISSYFLYALLLVNEMRDVGVDPNKISLARQYLKKIIQKNEFLYTEALLLDLYIKNILVGDSVVDSEIIQILDVDPNLTNKFRYNVFISQAWRQWSYLFQYCNKLSQISSGVLSKGLLVLCHLRSGRINQAQLQIEGALYASPKHPVLNSLDALIKKTKKLDVDASVALGSALKNNKGYLLPYIMQIEFCKSANDIQCVLKNAQILISKDAKSLEAKTALAWAFYKRLDEDGAISYIEEISLQTTDYIPALQVQDMIQGE